MCSLINKYGNESTELHLHKAITFMDRTIINPSLRLKQFTQESPADARVMRDSSVCMKAPMVEI